MRRSLMKQGTVAALAAIFVLAISAYAYLGEPADYCVAHLNPPLNSSHSLANPPLADAHWTVFPIVGASCSWQMATDVRYETSEIRAWPTVAILCGIAILIISVGTASVSLVNSRQ